MREFLVKHRNSLVYLPLAFYWTVLFALTSLPSSKAPDFTVSDKIQHYGAYAVLAFLLSMALFIQEKFKLAKDRFVTFSVIIATVYGLLDEIHQIFVPGRSADPFDLFADFIGALTGGVTFYFVNKYLIK